MKYIKILLAIFITTTLLAGCDLEQDIKRELKKEANNQIDKSLNELTTKAFNKKSTVKTSEDDKALIKIQTNEENYALLNDNKTTLTDYDQQLINKNGRDKFWADYSDLDNLGRGGRVTALVTKQAVYNHSSKAQERPSFDSTVRLAGEYKDGTYDSFDKRWRGTESNNQIIQLDGYRGYIYNKSHSLAWSLGGDMETHNLTLGTRSQNVGSNRASEGGGMGYPETQVRNAINNHPEAKIYYDVRPVYNNDELLPRGTHVRVYSINDGGKTVNLNVWVSNTQKGVHINYKDGTYNY
ncbi:MULTISPECIES: DNA/RNA non-specific endonuclease [unclassified Mammaliicoccus]|uniref:DNA/RNA non-specific endonuclease n=1 Tax=unclassified Mammaliicoccus TaxID=2803851 RepID=UPI001EFB4F2A